MEPKIPDEYEVALKEEKADLYRSILSITKHLDRVDRARNKTICKLIDLKARHNIVDHELAMATKLIIVDGKAMRRAEAVEKIKTTMLESILSDPVKAAKLMELLEGTK